MKYYTTPSKACFFLISFLLLACPAAAGAESLTYPRPCYDSREAEEVSRWESTWVGKKITGSNVDQVRELLPESFYALMKNTGRWGQSWFVIVPYRQILPTPGTVAFTKKYYKKSQINEKGEITGFVAGVPFPDTDNALEMAHNFRCRNYGDTLETLEEGYIVDGKLTYDMDVTIQNHYCFFSGRTDVPPVPELPDNHRGIWRAFHMLQTKPPEVRNMRILELHYKNRLEAYDSWVWLPTIRRMRRRSTSERQDAQGGADFCGSDNFGWDGPVSLNTYRYLGTKELLLARHTDASKLRHTKGECLWSGTQRERVRAHVIEATNQDPNFLYSRMIWYLDPETWQMLYADRYDRNGKLWKVLDQHGFVTKGADGLDINFFASNQMIDVQRIHATLAAGTYQFGIAFPQTMFTTGYLQKHGY